ncbi:hypothetical protein GCM10009716_15950 [Streptomyces sodiiphilus]|uniref:Tyr recombinase domain-containing protein n=1 Tax=Streptomyces sodiiphilus TaxID=226217 RepID=A0ABP5ADC9_9ACTN
MSYSKGKVQRMLTVCIAACQCAPRPCARRAAHLRFTHCSQRGGDARTIMETFGHSTITVTLDTCAHVIGHDAESNTRADQ